MGDWFKGIRELIDSLEKDGWKGGSVERADWHVTIVLLPPLATSKLERNRWPHEPEEGEEPSQEEREREWGDRIGS